MSAVGKGHTSSSDPPGGDSVRIPAPVHFALRLLLPEEEREFFLGDVEQSLRENGPAGRGRRSWLQEIFGALDLRLKARPHRGRTPHENNRRKGDGMLREFLSDLRFGFRMLLRSPGFTVVALVTMALGIGANTAMFSIVNGVALKPLAFPEADRIVFLTENNLSQGWSSFTLSPADYWDWEERNRSLELMGAYQRTTVNHTGGDRPETVAVYQVTQDIMEILGGQPVQGRGIMEEDLDPDVDPVAVLTHGFWQRALGGDPEALGSAITLDGIAHTVVGILGEDWRSFSMTNPDLILPLKTQPSWLTNRGNHFLRGLGRLAPGITPEQAQSDFSSIAAALEAEYPESNKGWGASVRPLKDAVLGSTGSQLIIFMASVGLVLLIACANLANMTLARATVRTRELAIRTAVGAGRGRVVRQLMAESGALALLGGALGVGLAHVALSGFVSAWPTMLPRMHAIEIDSTVLLFSLGLVLASGILFGLVPALIVADSDLAHSLRQGGRSLAGDRSSRFLRGGLVVAEVGLAVVLLVGTGLLTRSFSALQSEDPGFETQDRLVLAAPLPRGRYLDADRIRAFVGEALPRVEAIPGVESVALTSLVPLEGSDQIWGFWKEETPSSASEDGSTLFYRVSPGYFQTMDIPLLVGRGISSDDRFDGGEVAVVSASFAEQQFPGENPVGRRIRWGREEDQPGVEIVGVVGDVHHYNLGETPDLQVYVPFSQHPTRDVRLVVRTSIPPLNVVGGVREAIEVVDPDQPLLGIQAAESMVSESISAPRFRTFLMTAFGLTALLLAVIGLYGVMAYSVAQRSREIGVRMALGASRGSVLSLVFREGMPLVGVGLLGGVGAALALSRVLEAMLFGVGSRDIGVFAGVPLVLIAVAAAALLVPARRATRVDPVRTLGEE